MTRTCGECPWVGDVWIGAEPGDVHKCKASLDVRWVDMDDPVCPARHAFEVLRLEVRRLRGAMKLVEKDHCPPWMDDMEACPPGADCHKCWQRKGKS